MSRLPRSGGAPDRSALVVHLVGSGIAGKVKTPRENNLRHYRRFSAGEPYYRFGLTFARRWSFAKVLAEMAKRCGVDPDPDFHRGVDTINPERTVDALEAMADRLAQAARRGERVLLATGHPQSLLSSYQRWRSALAASGATALTGGDGARYVTDRRGDRERRVVGWQRDVAYVHDGTEPRHSHDPHGMQAILGDLTERGVGWPDLVIADHGFAGAAAEAGIEVVGFADCNDPALFVAEAEGKVQICVPLDDGYNTNSYAPLVDYVLDRAGL